VQGAEAPPIDNSSSKLQDRNNSTNNNQIKRHKHEPKLFCYIILLNPRAKEREGAMDLTNMIAG
jgi:hypothetical protein